MRLQGVTSLTSRTNHYRKLEDHIKHTKGTKTVCVSTCLAYFDICPTTYNYTSSNKNRHTYLNVLRRNGYSVRSRKSEFKVKPFRSSMTALINEIKASKYSASDHFIVCGVQTKKAHLMVVNGNGLVVIDTAPKRRWKVESVYIVEKA